MFIKSEDEFAKDFFADWLMVKSYLSFNKKGEVADSITDEVLISFVGLNSFEGTAGALLQGAIEKGLKIQLTDVSLMSVDPKLEMNLKKKLPRVFVALGEDAKNFFVSSAALTENQGKWLTWEGIKVMPTIHPEYVVSSPDAKKEFWEDLKLVMVELGL
jgi:hypothetical protein